FTEPYVRDRPISVGFSLYTQSLKFFGEGTLLSQNVNAISGALGNVQQFLSVGEENLFTQKSTGGSVFATSPLSEFWRPRSRRKRSRNPEVFGFRIMAGHVGSFGLASNIQAAQSSSLSFIAGVPVYERFFLGDETTIRGYNVRSISPIAPLEVFITSRNVSVSNSPVGSLSPISSISDNLRQQLVTLGTFTGASG